MLASILQRARSQFPRQVAVELDGVRLDYEEWSRRVEKLAGALGEQGLRAGERVAVLSVNSPWMLECYHAAAHAGLVLVPLNFRAHPLGLARIVRHSEARQVLVGDAFAELGAELRDSLGGEIPMLLQSDLAALTRRASSASPCGVAPDAPAHLYYTSGTTGEPKGVILTHRNVAAHALMAIAALQLCELDVWAHIAPMFHLADAWASFAVTWVGGQHRFLPRFTAESAIDLLADGTTITNLVPTMLSDIVHHPRAQRTYPALRSILSGGAPIAPALVDAITRTFGCRYVQTYGLTETSPFLTMSILPRSAASLDEAERRALLCKTGRPLAGVEIEVVREDGSPVRNDATEVGEIRARGDSVTPGYFKNEAATHEALRDGWLYTGDLAVVDAHGFLDIVDRKKDVIKTGAESVFSTEVEKVLYDYDAVQEAAVIGLPHPRWGEAVVGVVVLKSGKGAAELDLIEYCRAHLGRHQVPKRILFKPALPRTGSNKIAKRLLRDEFAGIFLRE